MAWLAFAVSACATRAADGDTVPPPLVVSSTEQLVEALQPVNAGRRIQIEQGDYAIDRPLHVPDGATLEGGGVMKLDAYGVPGGFEPGTETSLRVTAGFAGNVLTLGHGSVVRGLRVLDLANPPSQPSLRQGNVVYVASREPGDTVSASVIECELVNPNAVGFSDLGPHGHGLVALTLNPNLGAPPAAHEGARISVRLQSSIVRTHTGAVVFANNFATRGDVTVLLEDNRLEGYLTVGGGVSRPDAVTDSVMRIESRRNRYLRSGRDRYGWLLLGGSTSPHFLEPGIPGAARASVSVDSTDDRIEGFHQGIQASAARRVGARSSLLMDNRLDLQLRGTLIRTAGDGAADLVLHGTSSETDQAESPGEFPAGDGNVLRVRMEGVSGSGVRRNVYGHVVGPARSGNQGSGNRLEFDGDQSSFESSNPDLDPPPAAKFFRLNP